MTANISTIPALRVSQWLKEWDEVKFSPKEYRKKPKPYFFIFSLSAKKLKRLSGIYRRTTNSGVNRAQDLGIQRRHDPKRSLEIKDFISYGYPWSNLTPAKRTNQEFADLKKPGWLPTSIVINILEEKDKRINGIVYQEDLIHVNDDQNGTCIQLPNSFS